MVEHCLIKTYQISQHIPKNGVELLMAVDLLISIRLGERQKTKEGFKRQTEETVD